MRKSVRRLYIVAFVAYCAIMLWLLFFWRMTFTDPGEIRIFLVPFTSTKKFIDVIKSSGSFGAVWHAVKNLAGNIVLFMPLGIFYPVLFRPLRKYPYFFSAVAFLIIVIEITQYLTGLGCCDIDDFIFNTAGASAGFLVYRIIIAKRLR